MQTSLRFKDHLVDRPAPGGLDAIGTLRHFAIITYAADPARFAGLIHPRFKLDMVELAGQPKALLSVVPFIDVDFTSAVFPFPKFTMGQTNYRIYVIDTQTGARCVWFLGTTLGSWTRIVPRHLWKLPWHAGRITFDCQVDPATGRYTNYRMETAAKWAPAEVHLRQDAAIPLELPGFPDTETGLVCLTHPLTGFYYRRDGQLGSYRVWHKRINASPAAVVSAKFGLLSRMGLVTQEEQQSPHSVLMDPVTEFTIYLPPGVIA